MTARSRRRAGAGGAQPLQALRHDAGARRRVPVAARGRDPRAGRGERRRQVDPDQDPDRRRSERRGGGLRGGGDGPPGQRAGGAGGRAGRRLPGAVAVPGSGRGREHFHHPPRAGTADQLAADVRGGRGDPGEPGRPARRACPCPRTHPGRAAGGGDRQGDLARGEGPDHGTSPPRRSPSTRSASSSGRPASCATGRHRAVHHPPAGGGVPDRGPDHRAARRRARLPPAWRRR